jgi:hypothetical protein
MIDAYEADTRSAIAKIVNPMVNGLGANSIDRLKVNNRLNMIHSDML